MNWPKLCAGMSVLLALLCSADSGSVAQASGVRVSSGPCVLGDFPAGTALFPVKGQLIDDLSGAGISGATYEIEYMEKTRVNGVLINSITLKIQSSLNPPQV